MKWNGADITTLPAGRLTLLTGNVIIASMIRTFKCHDTQTLFAGRRVLRFVNIAAVAMRKLQQLHAAATFDFLRVPPGNRLEALQGNRQGGYSIRVNEQWRICFRFQGGDVFDVEIVDDH